MRRLAAVFVALWMGLWSQPVSAAPGHDVADLQALNLAPRADAARFALVIGSNATLDKSLAPLRFADDDAARVGELLLEVGFDVELLTELDQDSQQLFPDLVRRTRSPTKSAVTKASAKLKERMRAASDAGAEVEFLIYYSGHGDVGPDGQGFLTLQGGKLTRNQLFAKILAGSPARHNHVLIDACRSEQFVMSRGKGKWRADRAADATADVRKYLDRTHLGHFPNTGVIVAHSADQQTHEWERYRGGIFTHELVSGLRGGADLNGDGYIEYSELGAFVSAANSAVKDPRARLQVVVRPPRDNERHPVLVHRGLTKKRVMYFSGKDGRLYTVEDARGVRLADLRRSGESPSYLTLPGGEIHVQRADLDGQRREETTIGKGKGGIIRVASLRFGAAQRAAKGSLDQALRAGLFATPYGPGYYQAYTDTGGMLPVRDPTWSVEIWEEVDGEKKKVTRVEIHEAPEPAEPPKKHKHKHKHRTLWTGVSFGTIITPLNPDGQIRLAPKRVTSDQFRGCLAPGESAGCSSLRGFDVRWHLFKVGEEPGDDRYPRVMGYFRTGYTSGRADFSPEDGVAFRNGQARSLSYYAVPLFLGANVYAVKNFPLRPYAGLGFGFDVLRVDYKRFNRPDTADVSARIGFELHAGIELRITNYVFLSGEIQQLWSARRRLDELPDFSNEGFTVITSVGISIPLPKSRRVSATRVETRRGNKVVR